MRPDLAIYEATRPIASADILAAVGRLPGPL